MIRDLSLPSFHSISSPPCLHPATETVPLTAQQSIAQTVGPHQTTATALYTNLRATIIKTVYKSHLKTGTTWEQYSPTTGSGQGTTDFLGWNALILNIIAMPDLGNVPGGAEHIGDEEMDDRFGLEVKEKAGGKAQNVLKNTVEWTEKRRTLAMQGFSLALLGGVCWGFRKRIFGWMGPFRGVGGVRREEEGGLMKLSVMNELRV